MVEKFKKSVFVLAIVFGLISVAMIFCPAVVLDFEDLIGAELMFGVDGLKTTFGWEVEISHFREVEMFEFSFLQLLTYALPLVGVISLCYAVNNDSKSAVSFAILCFLVGALLFFLSTQTLEFADKETKKEFEDCGELGAGAIIGGISCLLAALCSWLHFKELAVKNQVVETNTAETQN